MSSSAESEFTRRGEAGTLFPDRRERAPTRRRLGELDTDNPIYNHSAALSAERAGDRTNAERLFLKALGGTMRRLGAGHPFMLLVVRDTALFYARKGNPALAAKLAKRALALTDPRVVCQAGDKTLEALSDLCRIGGCLAAAIPFYRAAVASRTEDLGNEHRKTRNCIARLAEIYRSLGEIRQAQDLLENANPGHGADNPGEAAA